MNITQDLSIIELIVNASLVVKLVMALLAFVSLMSWYWIFRKWFQIRDARVKTEKFEREFWSGGDLGTLYQSAATDRHHTGALERVFEAGFREFTKLRGQKSLDPATVMAGLLHDVPEDTDYSLEDIKKNFGEEITNLVKGITK